MNPAEKVFGDPIVKIALTFAVWVIILAILPASPFLQFIVGVESNALPYLNWFIPIGRCLTVMTVWWTAVITYYAISWILRQVGIIGGS